MDGEIWQVLAESAGWRGKDVLDVGCGDGFHLPRFAEQAKSVLGVEPHQLLIERALLRVDDLASVTVLCGCAQALLVADASVDVVHARTAYFFGPGCEPGLLEAERVLRPGGVFAIVDLDVSRAPTVTGCGLTCPTTTRWLSSGYSKAPVSAADGWKPVGASTMPRT